MTPPGLPGGAQALVPCLVLLAAVLTAVLRPVVRARRERRAASGARPRRGIAMLVVTGLVGASALLGTPAYAQSVDC